MTGSTFLYLSYWLPSATTYYQLRIAIEYFWLHSDILKNHNVNCNLPSCTIAAHRVWSTVMYHREWLPWTITSVLGLLQRRLKEWLQCSAYYSDDLKDRLQRLDTCVLIHPEDYVRRESVHKDVRRGNKQTNIWVHLSKFRIIKQKYSRLLFEHFTKTTTFPTSLSQMKNPDNPEIICDWIETYIHSFTLCYNHPNNHEK